ncbi:hypothetical protein ACQ0QQ_11130 [Lysinibacillus sphaericus]
MKEEPAASIPLQQVFLRTPGLAGTRQNDESFINLIGLIGQNLCLLKID